MNTLNMSKKMKKVLLSGFLVISSLLVEAQNAFLQDLSGRPIFENSETDVEGSPYLRKEWSAGVVTAKSNRKSYEIAKLRYDAYKDELEYDQAGHLFRLGAAEIVEFSTGDGTFRSGFPAINDLTKKNFYQVLYDGGNVKLLKRIYVIIQTEKPYNSATTTKRFLQETTLYLLKNNVEMVKLKKDKKSLLEALTNKQSELEAFIKDQKLKFSKDEDVIRILAKYEGM